MLIFTPPKCSEHCDYVYPFHFLCIIHICMSVSYTRQMLLTAWTVSFSICLCFLSTELLTLALHAVGFWSMPIDSRCVLDRVSKAWETRLEYLLPLTVALSKLLTLSGCLSVSSVWNGMVVCTTMGVVMRKWNETMQAQHLHIPSTYYSFSQWCVSYHPWVGRLDKAVMRKEVAPGDLEKQGHSEDQTCLHLRGW